VLVLPRRLEHGAQPVSRLGVSETNFDQTREPVVLDDSGERFLTEAHGQGAEIVSTTGEPLSSRPAEDAATALRKNTVAAIGPLDDAPDATLTSVDVSAEKPEPESRDQPIAERPRAEPTDRTHARDPLTLSERPWAEAFALVRLTAGALDDAIVPTCTLTRDGTVTETVWTRLLDD
jgi:hypothetical protein